MTNHHDEMRVAPDPSQAEELRQRLHARLASGYRAETQDLLVASPSTDTDSDLREGDIIMLDTDDRPTAHEPMSPRRRSPGRWLLVAAAVALVALVGTLVVAAGDDDDPVDTAGSPTTAAPSGPAQDVTKVRGASASFVELPPGRYFVDPDGDATTPLRVLYQVAPEGWQSWFGAAKFFPGGFTGLSITTVPNLVTDGCLDQTPLEPPVGPTVDDLATALSRLAPFDVTAAPTDVTLFGYSGKHLELTVPDRGFADCVNGELHSWISPLNDGSFYGYDGPGQTEEFWILDVEGTRLVLVKFDSPEAPADYVAERDAMFDSIVIEP